MNRLVVVIWLAVVALVAVVTGCDRAPRYDSRLVAADSLMQPDPDSALALVEAVAPGSLKAEGDRAYRDLLLTQARYRCYITATSDSDINRALDYYRQHDGELEKLTRAFIYKGAVMEELGHPDSAMAYYKTAETTAAPDDYFNLGYANLRIGELYQTSGTNDSAVLVRMKQAAKYFTITRDTSYLITAIGTQGAYLYDKDKDASRLSLERALSLAKTINSPKRFQFQSKLSGLYYYNGEYEKSKDLAMDIIHNGRDECDENQFYYYAAWSFIRMSRTDSAQWVRTLIPAPATLVDSMNHHRLLAELSEVTGNRIEQESNASRAENIHRRILEMSLQSTAPAVEMQYDVLQQKNEGRSKVYTIIGIGCAIMLVLVTLLAIAFYYSRHRYDRLMADLREECRNQSIDLNRLQRNLNLLKITDESVNNALVSHMELMRSIIDECYHTPNSTLAKSIRAMVHFQNNNQGLWEKMYAYIDMQYNHIMSHTRRNYPQLNERDLMLLALTTLDYSCSQIAIICGYSNATSISGNRQRLAKKMGLPSTLKDYIQSFKPSQDNIG